MESFFQSILHPKNLHLLVFGVLVFPAISWYLYWASFTWVPPFEFLLLFAFIVTGFIRLLAWISDREFKTEFAKYVSVLTTLLIVQTLIAYTLQAELASLSERQGEEIAEIAENYKREKGSYPVDFSQICFAKAPKQSALGTKFYYRKNENGSYVLEFKSFRGLTASYHSENKSWSYTD